MLGPESKDAFVNTLLALYKDPFDSAKGSTEEESATKKSALQVCERPKEPQKESFGVSSLWTTSTVNRWRLRISFRTEPPIQ